MEGNTVHFSAPIDRVFNVAAGKLRWQLWSGASKRNLFYWALSFSLTLFLIVTSLGDAERMRFHSMLAIGFGIAFLYQCYDFIHRKRSYLKAIEVEADHLLMHGKETAYMFTDEQMYYRDPEKYFEIKWSALKAHSLYKDHLLIWQNDSPLMTHVFKAGEEGLDDQSYSLLVELVKKHLPYKEVKR